MEETSQLFTALGGELRIWGTCSGDFENITSRDALVVLGTHSKPGCDWLRVATGPPVSVSGQGTHSVSVHRGNKREDDGEEGQVGSLARGVVGADHSDHTVQPQSGVTSFSSSCSAPSWSLLRGEGSFKGQCHHHTTPLLGWGSSVSSGFSPSPGKDKALQRLLARL